MKKLSDKSERILLVISLVAIVALLIAVWPYVPEGNGCESDECKINQALIQSSRPL